jgi:hypothetical protein
MPVWCSVPGCANYKQLQKCVIFHHPTYKRFTPAIKNDAVIKDYQMDLQSELLGNPFRRQLRNDATPAMFFFHKKTEDSQLELT